MSEPASKPNSKAVASDGLRLTPKAVLAIVIAVAALIFVFSNTTVVPLQFLWFKIEAPAWMMLLILFLAGFVSGFFMGRNRYKRK